MQTTQQHLQTLEHDMKHNSEQLKKQKNMLKCL